MQKIMLQKKNCNNKLKKLINKPNKQKEKKGNGNKYDMDNRGYLIKTNKLKHKQIYKKDQIYKNKMAINLYNTHKIIHNYILLLKYNFVV